MQTGSKQALAITAIAITIVAAALMQSGALRIMGTAPHVVLAALVAISFFTENSIFYGLVVLIGALFVRSSPAFFDPVAVSLVISATLIFLLERRLVWPGIVGVVLMSAIGTLTTYLYIEPAFLWEYPGVVCIEMLYTVLIAIGIFETLRFFFAYAVRR